MTDFRHVTLEPHQRESLLEELTAYAQTDLLCYFATEEALYARQCAIWEPVLCWIETQWNLQISRTQGIMPIQQPAELTERCRRLLQACDDAALVALAQMITGLGSILLAFACLQQHLTVQQAITASQLDETSQQAEWGGDPEIQQQLEKKAQAIRQAAAFLAIPDGSKEPLGE